MVSDFYVINLRWEESLSARFLSRVLGPKNELFLVEGKWGFVAHGIDVYFRTLVMIVCYGAHKQGGIGGRDGVQTNRHTHKKL